MDTDPKDVKPGFIKSMASIFMPDIKGCAATIFLEIPLWILGFLTVVGCFLIVILLSPYSEVPVDYRFWMLLGMTISFGVLWLFLKIKWGKKIAKWVREGNP